jgi:hypothetical protein
MNLVTLDFESFWTKEHSLSKMSPIAYVMHPDTEIISCSIKQDAGATQVYFGEDAVRKAFAEIDWSDAMALAHNMSGFDALILAWRFGITPRMWGCTLAMARPVHAKTCGLSLAKLVEHYRLGVKNNAILLATQGKHLGDFSSSELADMAHYNKEDTDQCHALFHKLRPHYSAKELWHIDANIRMFTEPKFEVDVSLLASALCAERDQKRKHLMDLSKLLEVRWFTDELEPRSAEEVMEEVRSKLASTAMFSTILDNQGVTTPMKASTTNPDKRIPALAKTDEQFIVLQNHSNPIVAAAARARLSVKSTLLETRVEAFLAAAKHTGGLLPIPTKYCGADTTGRDSGFEYNPQNLPRVNKKKPRISDALRMSLRAPKGMKVFLADQSGIELRVNHTLWKVKSTMELYQADPQADLYRAAGSILHGVSPEAVTSEQRQIEKIKQLGLGFGAGAVTFMQVAKILGGLDLTQEQAQDFVDSWRTQYTEIAQGWRTCHTALQDIHDGREREIDPWGLLVTCKDGIRLPSGRLIRYPNLRQERDEQTGKTEWRYGIGRHTARIYAGKIDENCVQALARDTLFDNAVSFYRETGMRPALKVHDELVYVGQEAESVAHLELLQVIMRKAPSWWTQLVTWSEGDIADTYGHAK